MVTAGGTERRGCARKQKNKFVVNVTRLYMCERGSSDNYCMTLNWKGGAKGEVRTRGCWEHKCHNLLPSCSHQLKLARQACKKSNHLIPIAMHGQVRHFQVLRPKGGAVRVRSICVKLIDN